MKTLLDIDNFGITLTYTPDDTRQYEVTFPDPAAPVSYIVKYTELSVAIDRVISLILDPNQVYAMEDMSEDIQQAYTSVTNDNKTREVVTTFLREVLTSMTQTNLLGGN